MIKKNLQELCYGRNLSETIFYHLKSNELMTQKPLFWMALHLAPLICVCEDLKI